MTEGGAAKLRPGMGPAELKKYMEEYNKKNKKLESEDLSFQDNMMLHVKYSIFALCSIFKNFGIVYAIITYLMPFIQDKHTLVDYKEVGLFANINPVSNLAS